MRIFFAIFSLLFIGSCSDLNSARVAPESLISASFELVSFVVEDDSISEVIDWASDDKPTTVNLSCTKANDNCAALAEFFTEQNIPSMVDESRDDISKIELVYERVAARNCSSRSFGCSVSVNSLQMVSDHRQFTSPALSDRQDAATAVNTYRNDYSTR